MNKENRTNTLLIIGMTILLAVLGWVSYDQESSKPRSTIADRLAGKLLIATESGGQLWYVHPDTKERHYITPDEAGLAELQVIFEIEEGRETEYTQPGTDTIYVISSTDQLLLVVQEVGVGISNIDLHKIPINHSQR